MSLNFSATRKSLCSPIGVSCPPMVSKAAVLEHAVERQLGLRINQPVAHWRRSPANTLRKALSFELKREDLVSIKVLDGGSGESRHSLYQVTRATEQLGHWVMGAWKLGAEDMWGAELEKLAATEARREFRDDSPSDSATGKLKDGQR